MANKKTIIGKTAPVPLGQQKAVNSLPVVFAEDQPAIPVEEQNKIQSEVALSLLGIPRAEVALGIFADVNTYDINPSEWSQFPIENEVDTSGVTTTGLNHLAEEAGAELVSATGKTTILTSKRFFRYQPGRVSSSTMGVKMNVTESTEDTNTANRDTMKGAPSIKKWGIFDKFDGYYYEVANGGQENDFRCVRRTQALVPYQAAGVETTGDGWTKVASSATGKSNMKAGNWGTIGVDPVVYRNGLCYVAAAINDPSLVYNPDNVRQIEAGSKDVGDFEYDEGYAVRLAYRKIDGTYQEHMEGRHYQFPFDQKIISKSTNEYLTWKDNNLFLKPTSQYIRLDAHCKWEDILTNLSRGGGTDFTAELALNGTGDAVNTSDSDPRYGYDTDPNENDSGVKVWNLLVTVQGGTEVTATQFDAAFGTDSHRSGSKEYSPTSTASAGAKNVTLKEWFKLCVPPEYRMVYEWRPVRAMFSGDQLNGSNNVVRWSDVSTANVDPTVIGVKRPGDPVTLDNAELTAQSQYNIDFSKVTMWKIEFSWYGAVGALFLCYVPVGNGEARWVRVHHMRASNQLDVASLGNATLPITYLTHGGMANNLTEGNRLVKYGASYYIDGGDKGTVRLLSKSTDTPKGIKYGVETLAATSVSGNSFNVPYNDDNRDQLIGSYLKADTTTRVIWARRVDESNVKLYFNRNMADIGVTAGDVELVVPRKQRAMIALRAKDNVINTSGTPVRNRIQLYPLKYGAGLTDGSGADNIVSLNFIKNPLLITNNLNNSGMSNAGADASLVAGVTALHTNAAEPQKGLDIGSGTVPKKIEAGNISGSLATVLSQDGAYFYAYMRAKPTNDVGATFSQNPGVDEKELLVKFYRKAGGYYIQNHESQSVDMTVFTGTISGVFSGILYAKMYTFSDAGDTELFTGTIGSNSTTGNHSKYENQKKWDASEIGNWESIAALSGAKISQDFKLAPVANTGNNVFSIYANKGGSQYDLEDYFAYNKEYISFPLTNEVDILGVYAHWESTSATSAPTSSIDIVNSLTWEEQ
jgi:hypothetical protein